MFRGVVDIQIEGLGSNESFEIIVYSNAFQFSDIGTWGFLFAKNRIQYEQNCDFDNFLFNQILRKNSTVIVPLVH